MFRIVVTLLMGISLSCTSQGSLSSNGGIVIPLDMNSGRPIVEVMVNNKGPYQFIFDTGSSTNVIDQALADKLKLAVVGEDELRSQGPNRLNSKRVKASTIEFPGTDISKPVELNTVGLRQMLPIDGVLSPIFFSDYLITMDFANSRLELTRGELNKNHNDVIEFVQLPRFINLNINVTGIDVVAHLDTGSPGSFSLPYRLKDQFKYVSQPVEDDYIRTPTAQFKKWKAIIDGEIKIGNVSFKNPQVSLVEGFEYANIGMQIFSQLKTTMDRKNHLMKVNKQSAASEEATVEVDDGNELTGWYGGKLRRVFLDGADLYIQRKPGPPLKLVKLSEDLYQLTFTQRTQNELPKVRFDRDSSQKVSGITLVFSNGREEISKKD